MCYFTFSNFQNLKQSFSKIFFYLTQAKLEKETFPSLFLRIVCRKFLYLLWCFLSGSFCFCIFYSGSHWVHFFPSVTDSEPECLLKALEFLNKSCSGMARPAALYLQRNEIKIIKNTFLQYWNPNLVFGWKVYHHLCLLELVLILAIHIHACVVPWLTR